MCRNRWPITKPYESVSYLYMYLLYNQLNQCGVSVCPYVITFPSHINFFCISNFISICDFDQYAKENEVSDEIEDAEIANEIEIADITSISYYNTPMLVYS